MPRFNPNQLFPVVLAGTIFLNPNITEARSNASESVKNSNPTELLADTTIGEDIRNAGKKTGRYIRDKYRNLRERVRANTQQSPDNLCKRQRAKEVIIVDRNGNRMRVVCK